MYRQRNSYQTLSSKSVCEFIGVSFALGVSSLLLLLIEMSKNEKGMKLSSKSYGFILRKQSLLKCSFFGYFVFSAYDRNLKKLYKKQTKETVFNSKNGVVFVQQFLDFLVKITASWYAMCSFLFSLLIVVIFLILYKQKN